MSLQTLFLVQISRILSSYSVLWMINWKEEHSIQIKHHTKIPKISPREAKITLGLKEASIMEKAISKKCLDTEATMKMEMARASVKD